MLSPARPPDTSLSDGPVSVLRAIGFVAVPILLLALLVGTLAVVVNPPV